LFKLITYNYIAAIWEPLIEKSTLILDYEKTTEGNIINKKLNFNISQYKQTMTNINISDLTVNIINYIIICLNNYKFKICFLYSTLNSWIEKYLKLKNNYQVEVKKIINDKNKVISNHKILNYTGRNLQIYKVEKYHNEKKKLKILLPSKKNL